MALLFTAEGATVVGADWHGQQLDETLAMVTAAGGAMTGVQGDVSVRAQAEAIVAAARERHGGLHVLVNNAGVMDLNQGAAEMDDALWDRVMGVNLNGPMYLTRAALPVMLAGGGGTIVNVASVAGMGGGAAGLAYTVSKHGLVGMTRQTAWRYGPEGIRCNGIAAGAVETNIMQSVDPQLMDAAGSARSQAWYAAIPRQLQADEIAGAALFLACDDSRGVNGAILPVDGGWLAA
ncbi:MAG: SDR family oxidoreductase [Thermoleophilia bacterium]